MALSSDASSPGMAQAGSLDHAQIRQAVIKPPQFKGHSPSLRFYATKAWAMLSLAMVLLKT